MESIVSRIIEIDRNANEKLAASEAEQRAILADAKTKAVKQREALVASADKRIAELTEYYNTELEQKNSELLQAHNSAKEQLDRTFAEQRGQIENDLFSAILGI